MSINLRNYNDMLQEKRIMKKKREKLMKELKKMVDDMQQDGKEPLSDEEFQELVELAAENFAEKRKSVDIKELWKRYIMYIRRKKLLAKEILRLKKESHKENMEQVNDLIDKLNDGEFVGDSNVKIEINQDRTPVFLNTFKRDNKK